MLNAHSAKTCSCIGSSTIAQELEWADVVIVGKVISSKNVKVWQDTTFMRNEFDWFIEQGWIDSLTMYEDWKENSHNWYDQFKDYKIAVLENLNSKRSLDTLVIRTGLGSGDCGFPFKTGEDYLIYGIKESKIKYRFDMLGRSRKEFRNIFRTNICRRTKHYNNAIDEILQIKSN